MGTEGTTCGEKARVSSSIRLSRRLDAYAHLPVVPLAPERLDLAPHAPLAVLEPLELALELVLELAEVAEVVLGLLELRLEGRAECAVVRQGGAGRGERPCVRVRVERR